MVGGDQNTRSKIQLLVNYWEMRPSSMGERLDALLRSGINHIATFVPWQAVESDISHTLPRFLQTLRERKMTVSLILTPEVGVQYPNSGLPKDLFSKPEALAKDANGKPVLISLPPNVFALPSLLAPEFTKRYQNFLTRIDALLAELERVQPDLLSGVTAVLSGSLWKYYRSAKSSTLRAFASTAGDYSGSSAVSYRQSLEKYFSQREFSETGVVAANRWKTRQVEDVNRRWFSQQGEEFFRVRSSQFVRKRAVSLRVEQVELFTPEADPSYAYSHLLQLISGGGADFNRFSAFLDEAAARCSGVAGQLAPSFVHWTGFGAFRALTDAEKQFLILKSLLLMGGKGGGLLIDEAEWFSLSHGFRARAESLARALDEGELKLGTRALYLVPHLWSGSGTLWEELQDRVGTGASLISSLDLALQESQAQLLMVDPSCIITRKMVLQLVEWAKSGRVVVFPRTPLYSDAARREIERVVAEEVNRRGSMEIDLGVAYQLYPLGNGTGRLVIFNLPEGAGTDRLSLRGEALQAWQTFVSSLLSVAGIQPLCNVSDTRLTQIPLERRGGGLGVFVLNSSARSVAGDLLFPMQVEISELSLASASEAQRGGQEDGIAPAHRFALEVPARGILPIAVEGMDGLGRDLKERREAQLAAEITRDEPLASAAHELPGFNPDMESAWN